MKGMSAWRVKTLNPEEHLNVRETLFMLANNDIAAVRVPKFFSEKDCKNSAKHILEKGIDWYPNSVGKQGRIGLSATGYCSQKNGKENYFKLTPHQEKIRDTFFPHSNPLQKVIEFLSDDGKETVSLATEESMGNARYFAGLIRAMGAKSTLHFDFAPNQLPGWDISRSNEQFAIVLYLQMPIRGGGLLIYDRPWNIKDEIFNNDKLQKGPFGFDPAVVKDEQPTEVLPVAGDLFIFRTRNFHQINEMDAGSSQYRLTFSSFLCQQDDKLLLWS